MATMLKLPERKKIRETTERARESFHRTQNVGGPERVGRIVLGTAAAVAALMTGVPWVKALLTVAGVTGLATGVSGYCPVNKAAGRDSYHHKKA